jgi:hypothetical protein
VQKNVSGQKLICFAFDSTTGLPKAADAANITAYVSKDYGAVTVLGDTSATEMDATNAKGYYLFDLTQAETNADTLLFSAKSSTSNIVVVGAPAAVFTTPANFDLLSVDGSGRVDVIKVNGTSQTARDLGASVLLSVGTGTGQVNLATGKVPATLASTDVTGNVAADVQTIKTQSVTCAAGITVGAFVGNATAALGVDASGRVDLGKILGTASAGTAGYIGPDWGHVNAPTTTVGLTGTTISTSQTVASVSDGVTVGTNNDKTGYSISGTKTTLDALNDITAAAVWAAGTRTLTASLDPTSAVIAAAVWDLATSGHTSGGTFGAAMNAAGSAGDPWGTALPGTYGAGTAGFLVGSNLNAAVSSRSTYAGGDTSGTTTLLARLTALRAGYLDNLSAGAVALAGSAPSWYTAPVDVSSNVSAIKAKTDNLPAAPADETLLIAATNAVMARLGAPAGASLAADIATRLATSGYTAAPTVAAIATGVWQDTTAGDFTVAGSIGKSLFTSGAVPGAAGGLFIAGTNAATTITTALTTTFTGSLIGSVGSVTAPVTVGTNSDKAGYSLATAGLDTVHVETGLNARQALAIIASACAGVLSGASGTDIAIAAAGVPATNRIAATVDGDGNRTAVTLTPPA